MSDSLIRWTVAEIVEALEAEVANQDANAGNNMRGWSMAAEFVAEKFLHSPLDNA